MNALRERFAARAHEHELERVRAVGGRFVVPGDAEYPSILGKIYAPPIGLYVKGDRLSELLPMVAVVGTRAPTRRGVSVARDLAAGLAGAGVTVVSGLARGIDTAAHEGALEARGTTVAVLGNGIDVAYPPENDRLAIEIASRGALVSEFPMGRPPSREAFPRRNRIVAGLAAGVVVVEADEKSGALITAARALEEGREVFAVPGPVDEPQSRGPNGLIREGARLVENAAQVLADLEAAWGPFARASTAFNAPSTMQSPRANGLSGAGTAELGRRVAAALTSVGSSIDEIATIVGASVSDVASELVVLELAGVARRCPGGKYAAGHSLGRQGR